MVASNARKNFGFLHISFYKVVQIVLPIINKTEKERNFAPFSIIVAPQFYCAVRGLWLVRWRTQSHRPLQCRAQSSLF